MPVDVDFSQFNALVVALGKLEAGSEKNLVKAVEVNARRVKDAWNGRLYSEGHASRTSRAITYDIEIDRDGVTAEIGARRGSGRQAGVVRLLENGSIKNPAHGYGAASLEENAGDLEQGVRKALLDSFGEAGL